MSTKERIKATLNISVDIDCPECNHTLDLLHNDDENIVTDAIFGNLWEDLAGYDITCTKCGHEFLVDEIEY